MSIHLSNNLVSKDVLLLSHDVSSIHAQYQHTRWDGPWQCHLCSHTQTTALVRGAGGAYWEHTWTPYLLFLERWEYSNTLRMTPSGVITGQKNGRQRCHRDAWCLHYFYTTISDLSSLHVACILDCEAWSTSVYFRCLLPQSKDCHQLVLLFEW